MITYKPENILLRKSNRQRTIDFGGSAPEPPGFIALFSKGANKRRRQKASPLCKSDTALGSRPRVALSSVPAKQLYFNIQLFQLSSSFSQIVLDIGYTLNCENGISRNAELEVLDVPNRQSSNIYNNNTYKSESENNQSVSRELDGILTNCHFETFEKNTANMLSDAVRTLYYTERIRVGEAVLPKTEIRRLLNRVNSDTLIDVLEIMRKNEAEIRNPTGYLYSLILNSVSADRAAEILELPDSLIKREMLYASE